ncbi:MAG TPA: sigma-70 family RNA polymerase sigma factor [Jiangellaceae bacterium]|nr:sigma-70 family RNA polymerase sigma factor [Jiangellaceae bacterium]
MQPTLGGAGHDSSEELANQAADDALTSLLAKVHTFQGRSRFTTWAYKFAILQAATEVRRQAWRDREISLDDAELRPDERAGPEAHAEATDLASAVSRGMVVALTGHQRRIAVALLVEQVPIDVLADHLGTTRGALYKTLHEVRTRLRRYLAGTGHLPGGTEAGTS